MSLQQPVLVTGAGGFLGRRLVRKLLERGEQVRAFVRSHASAARLREETPAEYRQRLSCVLGDVLRPRDCQRASAGCGIIFHLAAQMTGGVAPLILANVVGTKRLLEAAADAGARRVVLVSSIAVYDTQQLRRHTVIDEALPLDQQPHLRDPYTFSKVEQEHAALATCQARGLPLVIVRPGVIYGAERESLSARVGLRLGRLVLGVRGSHPLPYTHVENCADAVLLAGTAPGVEGQAFNIVDDQPPTAGQVLAAYRSAGKRLLALRVPFFAMQSLAALNEWYHRWSLGQLPAVLTPYRVRAMWKPLRYSNRRAKDCLQWVPKLSWNIAQAQLSPPAPQVSAF